MWRRILTERSVLGVVAAAVLVAGVAPATAQAGLNACLSSRWGTWQSGDASCSASGPLSLALAIGAGAEAVVAGGLFNMAVAIGAHSTAATGAATYTVTTTFNVGNGPVGVVFSPDGTRAYVANFGPNTVSLIDTAAYAARPVIRATKPQLVAITPRNAMYSIGTTTSTAFFVCSAIAAENDRINYTEDITVDVTA
jgi:YVTN family beta-propeller protein